MTQKTPAPSPDASAQGERLSKLIARAGICSRRDAERLIEQGRVELEGQTVKEQGTRALPHQRVTIDGEALPMSEPPRLWRYHKPVGVLTTARDPQGRRTIYDDLASFKLPRVMPVGRLDINSEGLLLLTNDGALKRQLELPATGWVRRYKVRVHGRVQEKDLAQLAEGVTIEGVRYDSIRASLERQTGANAWIIFALKEGKNREIRKVCQYLGYSVNRLIRLSYGSFMLGSLEAASVEEVEGKVLAEQLGNALPQAPEGRPHKPRRGRPAEAKKPAQGRSSSGKSGPSKSGPSKSGPGKPNQGKPNQGKPNQGKPSQGKPSQGKARSPKPRR